MEIRDVIQKAIVQRRRLEFQYEGAPRVVEPQILGINQKGNEVLNGLLVSGHSESHGQGQLRDYVTSKIKKPKLRQERFSLPHPEYKPGGGKKFKIIICELLPRRSTPIRSRIAE